MTDGLRTDGRTQATTIPEGQNWPRVKTTNIRARVSNYILNVDVITHPCPEINIVDQHITYPISESKANRRVFFLGVVVLLIYMNMDAFCQVHFLEPPLWCNGISDWLWAETVYFLCSEREDLVNDVFSNINRKRTRPDNVALTHWGRGMYKSGSKLDHHWFR